LSVISKIKLVLQKEAKKDKKEATSTGRHAIEGGMTTIVGLKE